MIWYRFGYRPLMRLAHRFGWHYAPRNVAFTNEHGWHLCRCSWCGLSGFVMPPNAKSLDEMNAWMDDKAESDPQAS